MGKSGKIRLSPSARRRPKRRVIHVPVSEAVDLPKGRKDVGYERLTGQVVEYQQIDRDLVRFMDQFVTQCTRNLRLMDDEPSAADPTLLPKYKRMRLARTT